ncbi:MAG: YerC/YecD family TrpR-related protein [Faecalibacterium sp.]
MAKDHPTGKSNLYKAMLSLKTPEECYLFFQDVCSYSELSAMEQRYDIAEMLQQKRIYTEIMEKTGASSAIISRVSRVLGEENSILKELTNALATENE